MADKCFVMGFFRREEDAAAVITEMTESAWTVDRVHSPIPSTQIAGALKVRKSRVGYFTLAGGILGFFLGFALAVFTATRWNLIVSGKPVVALVPFFIVGFEFTILFAVFGNVIGILSQAKIPNWKGDAYYDPRCSGEHFGVLASCAERELGKLIVFFKDHGADVREYDR
jgi:hypothetical protein